MTATIKPSFGNRTSRLDGAARSLDETSAARPVHAQRQAHRPSACEPTRRSRAATSVYIDPRERTLDAGYRLTSSARAALARALDAATRVAAARRAPAPGPAARSAPARRLNERRTRSISCAELLARPARPGAPSRRMPPSHALHLRLELEHALDAREVHAHLGGELLDPAQPLDVLLE